MKTPGYRDGRDPFLTPGTRLALFCAAAGLALSVCSSASGPNATAGGEVELQGTASANARAILLHNPLNVEVTGPTNAGSSSAPESTWNMQLRVSDTRSGAAANNALYCFTASAHASTAHGISSETATGFSASIVEGGTCDKPGNTLAGVQLTPEAGFKGWEVNDLSGGMPNIISDPKVATKYAGVADVVTNAAINNEPVTDTLLNTISTVEQQGLMATATATASHQH